MSRFLKVKNYDEYQHYHYSDWSPPWIKLYNRLLDDYAFLQMPEVAQRHLICLWLLASRHHNRIPNDLTYIVPAIRAKSTVDLESLIREGWLIPTDEAPASKSKRGKKLKGKKQSRTSLEPVYKKYSPDIDIDIDKDKELIHGAFEWLWERYPKRDGSNPKKDAWGCFHARLVERVPFPEMRDGLERYAAWVKAKGIVGTDRVMQAKRFFGVNREFQDEWKPNATPGSVLPFDRESWDKAQGY